MHGQADSTSTDTWTMTAEEVCRALRIGRNTYYDWCKRGLIPHVRVGGRRDESTGEIVGGRILTARKRLEEWLASNESLAGGGA